MRSWQCWKSVCFSSLVQRIIYALQGKSSLRRRQLGSTFDSLGCDTAKATSEARSRGLLLASHIRDCYRGVGNLPDGLVCLLKTAEMRFSISAARELVAGVQSWHRALPHVVEEY